MTGSAHLDRPVSLRCGRKTWQWLAVAVVSLVVAGGGCGGCGGCGCSSGDRSANRVSLEEVEKIKQRNREKAAEEKKEQEAARKKQEAEKARKHKEDAEKAVAARMAQESAKPAAKPKPPPRPEDFSQWRDRDYLAARSEGDPRLVQAVEARAKAPQGNMAEAELLRSLLASPPPQTNGDDEAVARSGAAWTAISGPLVRAVVAALAANNTDAARQTLGQIAAGEFPSADSRSSADLHSAVDTALAALVRRQTAECDQLVVQILAESRLAGGPSTPPRQSGPLGRDALAALQSGASPRLRKLLAEACLGPSMPAAQRELFLKVLLEPNPLNLEAQVMVYQGPVTDAATRGTLEKQWAASCADALRMFLGFASRQPGAAPLPPDWHEQVAARLWDPRLAAFLDLEHQAMVKLADRPSAIALAAAIPTTAMRTRLRRTLVRHWHEGPQTIRAACLTANGQTEPGFLAVLKSAAAENWGGKPVRPRTGRPGPDAETRTGDRERSRPGDEWTRLIGEIVRDYCRRCHLAALAEAAAARKGGTAAPRDRATPDAALPLHPGAAVRAENHVDWPGALGARLPQLAGDGWRLDYVRIEERTRLAKPLAYYRRQLKSASERALVDGLWLDGWSEPVGEGRARSIDVLMTLGRPSPYPPLDEDQLWTFEILSVEVPKLGD